MTTLREAAQQALEFIKATNASSSFWLVPESNLNKTVKALRAALEQPEQEPVASIYVTIGGDREFDDWRCPLPVGRNLLYTHPPRREWRGLTEEEMKPFCDENFIMYGAYTVDFIRAVEQALKEKNT